MRTAAPRTYSQRGLSILESAACLVMLLPLVTAALALADYMHRTAVLEALIEGAGDGAEGAKFHVGTFVQDYFLHPQPDLVGAKLHRELGELEERLRANFGELPYERFRLEIGAAMFTVNPQTGRLSGTVNFRGPLPPGCGAQELAVKDPFENGGGVIICRRGTLNEARLLLRERFSALAGDASFAGSAGLPSLAAHPAGLLGTRMQAHFGPSHIFGSALAAGGGGPHPAYVSEFGASNYLRAALVLGFAAEVDLSGTLTHRWLAVAAEDPVIEAVRVLPARADF